MLINDKQLLTLPIFKKETYEKRVNEEFEWLENSFDQRSSTWTPWTPTWNPCCKTKDKGTSL